MQKHKFKFFRGDDKSYRLLFRNKDGSPVNLDGVRFDLHVVPEGEAEPVISLSSEQGEIEIVGNGEVIVSFAHAHTQTAEWETANYDLQMRDANGKRKTLLYGVVQLIADQTRI